MPVNGGGQDHAQRLRLLIAEDDALIRTSLCLVLQAEHDIVGALDNGPEVLTRIDDLHPDILLLDISLPGLNGLKVARRLRQSGNATKIIFLTVHSEPVYVKEARRIGAEGYVLKGHVPSELSAAIQQVSHGSSYVSPELAPAPPSL